MILERRFIINLSATVTAFVIGLCINFFLTPFIVENLGREAFGFIGLSNDFLNYFTLITIALNAMAGRFITIRYVEGNIGEAKKYMSSVFFANIILAAIILISSIQLVIIAILGELLSVNRKLLEDIQTRVRKLDILSPNPKINYTVLSIKNKGIYSTRKL